MPNVRRSDSMRSVSWVAAHCFRRDSRGCDDDGVVEVVVWLYGSGPTPARSVSWRPGAEGAPWAEGRMWEKVEAWLSAGTIRRDWVVGEMVSLLDVPARGVMD